MNVSRAKLIGLGLAIFAGALWLYWPCTDGEFLRWDDHDNLQQEARWNGLTWNAVKWAFTNTRPYYQPLPRLSHSLDYQIWGEKAAGHHATNVVLHALNAMLVFGLVWTLLSKASLSTGERVMIALGVTGTFVIHPLQAGTVTWISARTHLVCATFGIGALWAYAACARRWMVWLLFTAALLSQPIAVSLPFAMLAIDYFTQQRHEPVAWGRLLREKAAFIVLAVAVGLVTMITATGAGCDMSPLNTVPLSQHVLLMFRSLAVYTWEVAWPVHLSPYYPFRSDLSLYQCSVLASVLFVGIITALAAWYRRRLPALATAWGTYLAFIIPVSGLMQTGSEATASRYLYMAILPLLLLAGGAVVWLWRRSAIVMRIVLAGLLVGELCIFVARTRTLTLAWRTDEMLWREVRNQLPDLELANRLLALALLDQGRGREALESAQRYVEIVPDRPEPHNILGLVLVQLGGLRDAVAQYQEALRISPDYAEAQLNLGAAMGKLGQPEEAARHYKEALRIRPNDAEAHIDLGIALMQLNQAQDAIGHYEEALRINPEYAAAAHLNLANALLLQGRMPDAIRHYEEALRINPDDVEAHDNFGIALARAGRIPEAIGHWEEALRINPADLQAHCNLGNALEGQGRVPEAIDQYEQALRLRPDFTAASNALARLRAAPTGR